MPRRHWPFVLMAVLAAALAATAATTGPGQEGWQGVLDEHPSIQYATRPPADRVARLSAAIEAGSKPLDRDARTGYLAALLDALDIPKESQILVFSRTGVQRAYTSPRTPRAIYFNDAVFVGYVPDAPAIEIASLDPQQGLEFYTVDQAAARPVIVRRTMCLTCHVSAGTLTVPGVIARSHTVDDDGNLIPGTGSHEVNHTTSHPDRWGGWFVTSEGAPAPYSQRGHGGNITFTPQGNTSNQLFTEWLFGSPDERRYPAPSSDAVALLAFDHQSRAMNLLTRLNWEARVAGSNAAAAPEVRALADELAEYLLFVDEAPLPVPLIPLPGFADRLRSRTPKDGRGRSFGQLELTSRLLRYPCSYMIYSEAFDGLPAGVKRAVYARMRDVLSGVRVPAAYARVTAEDRRAIEEILRDTKPDFSGH